MIFSCSLVSLTIWAEIDKLCYKVKVLSEVLIGIAAEQDLFLIFTWGVISGSLCL